MTRACREVACGRRVVAWGLCVRHYRQAVRVGAIVARPRGSALDLADPIDWSAWFAARVTPEPNTGCWLWTGAVDWDGYGVHHTKSPAPRKAHRIAWLVLRGPILPGLYVCHHCDQRGCVNPEHLFLGTQTDNMRDAASKGRTNAIRKLTPSDVIEAMAALAAGDTLREVGRRFGVSRNALWSIRHGRSWRSRRAIADIREARAAPPYALGEP